MDIILTIRTPSTFSNMIDTKKDNIVKILESEEEIENLKVHNNNNIIIIIIITIFIYLQKPKFKIFI